MKIENYDLIGIDFILTLTIYRMLLPYDPDIF